MKTSLKPATGVVLVCMLLSVFALTARGAVNVLEFTGNGSYIDLGKPSALHMSEDAAFTIEGWMKLNDTSDRDMLYSRREDRGSDNYTYMFGFFEGDKMSAYIGHGGDPNTTWRHVDLDPVLETDRWYHLAFSFDGDDLVYYLDGAPIGTNEFRYSNHAGYQVMIGGYHDGSDVDGYKTDMRVWNYARSEAQIQGAMYERLTGEEAGLLGYWPMNEGVGTEVYDATVNATTGTIVNAEWTWAGGLDLSDPELNYLYAMPFTIADIETGSERFTNSNEVDVVNFPVPAGYDRFQITESGEVGDIDPNGWTNEAPDRIEFNQPSADTNITRYAWFTNSSESVTIRRGVGEIIYTTVAPVISAVDSLEPFVTAGYTVRLTSEDLDTGSTSGDYEGEPIGIYRLVALDAEGQASNLTPNEVYFTAAGVGSYSVRLKVINMAGNYSFSSPVTLEVEEATDLEPGKFGDLYVALHNLHADANEPFASWTTAAATIQEAVNLASNNATIWVAPGIYYGADNWQEPGAFANVVNITTPVHVRGAVERERVIIDGYGLRRGVRIANSGAVVERFTIRRGFTDGSAGAGVAVNPGTLRDCLVTNNRAEDSFGGGIYMNNGALVDGCVVVSNLSVRTVRAGYGWGGGIDLQGNGSTVRNSRIMYNATSGGNIGGGGLRTVGDVTLISSLIAGNSAPSGDGGGIGQRGSGNLTIWNCTIVDNTVGSARNGGGVHSDQAGSAMLIENSIVYGNLRGATGDDIRTTRTVELDHVLTEHTTGVTFIGDNNITDQAPEFVDAGAGNYRLAQGSPCINAGFNQEWMDDATDLDGRPRLDSIFNEVDLGAYEFVYKGSVILFR